MAKQSWKEQMYQQIANSQVQQVMQQQRAQQLQNDFANWQKQQNDIAQLQASFNEWKAAQPVPEAQPEQAAPVQTAPAQTTQEIPSIKNTKPKRDLQAEAQEYFARVRAEREQERNAIVNDTLNTLNSKDFKDMAKKGKAQSVIAEKERQKKADAEALEKRLDSFDDYGYLRPDKGNDIPKLTDDQKALEEQILNSDRYVDNVPKERWNERFLTKQEKADAISNTTQADVDRWLSPETKLTQKEKGIARAYAAAELKKIPTNASTHQPIVDTDAEKQHYRDMVEIMNKTNPVSSVMSAYTELPLNLVDMVGDAGRSLGNQIGGLGSAITDKLGITEGATQRHNERMTAANEAADLKEANQRQSMANAQTQYPFAYGAGKIAGQVTAYALTNPVFDGIAEGAGVTNELAKFFINQGAQNAQDLALDTAPLVKQLMSDGSMSEEDKREVFNNVVLNALGNAGIGVAQEIPNIAKYAGVKIDARRAADEAFRQNVREGADKLARLAGTEDVDNVVRNATRQAEEATQNIENIARQMPEIPENVPNAVNNIPENVPENVPVRPGTAAPVSPAIENEAEAMAKAMDAEDVARGNLSIQEINRKGGKKGYYVAEDLPEGGLRNVETGKVYKTREEAEKALEGYRSTPNTTEAIEPETPKLLSDDVEAQLAYDFENLGDSYYGNRAEFRQSIANKDFSIPNTAINDVPGKNGKMQYEIVDLDNNRKIKTYASRKAAEKAQAEYAAGNVLKEKALKAYDDLDGAIHKYEVAAYNSADVEEVNTAKKAVEAARKRYERAMKEYDPSYHDAIASKDFGEKIARPYYTRNPAAENPVDDALIDDMVNDWVQTDANNPNRFVRDAEPETQNVFRGVENNTSSENDLWDQLKAGEQSSMPNGDRSPMPMNLQIHGEEPTSRAGKILQEIRQGEGATGGPQPKVSEFYNNSMQRNKYAWDAEDLSDLYTADRFEYLPTSEKTSVKNAFDNVKANRDSLIDRYSRQADNVTTPKEMNQFYNSQDIDQMHLLIRDLRRKEALATDPAQKALLSQQRYEITKHLYDATHSSAAVMQAGQKWLNDADGILDTAESIRIKKANEIFEDNPKLKQEADRVAENIYNRFKELEKNNLLKDFSEEERKARLRELIDDALSNSEIKRRLGQEDIERIANNLMQTPTADRIKQGIEDALTNIGWIKDETVQEVYDIWSQIEDLDPGSKQFQKEVTKIYTMLANDIGGSGTFWDKVDSWRYFAMLANPTTHIRNLLGNVTMNWMTGIKNDLAAGMEALADRLSKNGIQGGRTKAILTTKDGDLIKQSGEYFDNHAYGEFAQGGNRYMSASSGIDDAIPTFNTKALDKVVKGHSNLLSAEDVKFGKAKYKTSLAGFLKANGADASIFNATDAASKDLLERAHRYAMDAANEATFHTENAAANALSQFTKNLKASDNVLNKSLGIMIDTTVPFKKTPMNILKNCFEYSPVEFAKVIVDIGNWKKGKIATSTMIDNLSKAITGTGGMAIGALLAHEGIIKITNGTNKEQSFDKLMGQQALALNIMGHDVDISFLPPSVMPLIMGATLLNDYKQKYGDNYTALDVLTSSLTDPELAANTALESLDTIVDTTMLSGINDLINTIRYAEEPQDVIKSLAAKTVTNYAGQMIPTLVKKTSSVVDGKKYSSYSDKTGAAKTLDSSLKYLKTTVPGLQQAGKAMEGSSNRTIKKIGDAITAEPKINGWGEAEKKEDYGLGIGGRAIDQYLNPATTTKNTEDRTTQEIRALSKRLNDDSILDIGNISTSESKFSLNNQQYKLNEKQWTTYSRIEGHTAKDLADSYVRGEQWNNDTDQDRADTVKKMKSFSKAYAQSKVTGADMSSTNKELAKIYEKDGAKGLIEEFHRQTVFSKYEVSKSDGANAVYQDLGETGVEKYAKFKKKLGDSTKSEDVEKMLNSSGMSKSDKAKYYSYLKPSATPGNNPYGYIPGVSYDPEKDESYQKAVKAIPSLKPEKYYETKDTIDSDKNGTLKQEELINYINSKAKSNDEAQKMWAAYGGWTNKEGQIKKLVGSPGHYTSSY